MSALAGIDIALWDLKGTKLFQNALYYSDSTQQEDSEFRSTNC
jgi:hypothetical protein